MTIPAFGQVPPLRRSTAAAISYVDETASTSDSSQYTFSSRSIGAAASDRVVVVAVASEILFGGTSCQSVTIGGNAATKIDEGASAHAAVSLWRLKVPTGTTATVVASFADTQRRCGIIIFRIVDQIGDTPTDYSHGAASTTLDIESGGCALAAFVDENPGSKTFTGITERFDGSVESSMQFGAGCDNFSQAYQNRTISVTSNITSIVAAAWR